MKVEAERLIEAFSGPGWDVSGRIGEMERFNFDRTRKLTYRTLGEGDHGSFAVVELSMLNEADGWSKTFSMRYFSSKDSEELTIAVEAIPSQGGIDEATYAFSYSSRNGRDYIGLSIEMDEADPRAKFDRKELYYDLDMLPLNLDYEATANLFIEQVIKGEMTRPVLV